MAPPLRGSAAPRGSFPQGPVAAFRLFLGAAALLPWAASGAGGRCPAGVLPGEYYGDATHVWKAAGPAARCAGKVINVSLPEDDPAAQMLAVLSNPWVEPPTRQCAGVRPGEEPVCRRQVMDQLPIYSGFRCPLAPAADEGCNTTQGGAGGAHCFSEGECFEEYGGCHCVQCPCAIEGQRGPDCGICEPSDCDEACRQRMLVPGAVLHCSAFESYIAHPIWNSIESSYLSEPLLEYEIHRVDDEEMSVVAHLMFSLCSEAKGIFSLNMTGCRYGPLSGCASAAMEGECLECDTIRVVSHDESPVQWLKEYIATLNTQEDLGKFYMQCRDGLCSQKFDPVLLSTHNGVCTLGARCVSRDSPVGQSVSPTATVSDDTALGVLGTPVGSWAMLTICVIAVLMTNKVLAHCSQFKVVTDPRRLEGAEIEWDHVSFGGIVSNVSGSARPGSLVGILAADDSRKTTLVKLLTGRIRPDSGTICVNGKRMVLANLVSEVQFVPKEDIGLRRDTVAEAIGFAAKLSGSDFPDIGALKAKAHLQLAELTKGERKLVHIYTELARRPQVLVLDEPTTGLDVNAATKVMEALKKISWSIPVVTTLHNPPVGLTKLLTDTLLLAGDAGGAQGAARGCLPRKAPLPSLPAAGNLANNDATSSTSLGANSWSRRSDPPSLTVSHASSRPWDARVLGGDEQMPERVFRANWNRTLVPQWKRMLMLVMRDARRNSSRAYWIYLPTFVFSFLLGCSNWQLTDSEDDLHNRIAVVAISVVIVAIVALMASEDDPELASCCKHELESNVYSMFEDAVLKLMRFIPQAIKHAALVMMVVYPSVGLSLHGAAPATFALALIASYFASACIATLVRGRSQKLVGRIVATALVMLLLFGTSGYLAISRRTTSRIVAFLEVISPFSYLMKVLIITEVMGREVQLIRPDAYGTKMPASVIFGAAGYPQSVQEMKLPLSFFLCLFAGWVVACVVALSVSWPGCRCGRSRERHVGQLGLDALFAVLGETSAEPGLEEEAGGSDVGAAAGGGPIEISWEGLHRGNVHNVSGGARTGELVGVAGLHGAGKTVLVKMLAGHLAPDKGQIYVNGCPVTPWELSRLACYVPQGLELCGEDTIEEVLRTAMLFSRGQAADALDAGAKAELGDRMKHLSIRQHGVVSLFAELARGRRLLIVDEPCAGMPPADLLRLMQMLKRLSRKHLVVMALDQPPAEVQGLLTHVMVLHKGGLVISQPFHQLPKSLEEAYAQAQAQTGGDRRVHGVQDTSGGKGEIESTLEKEDANDPLVKPQTQLEVALYRVNNLLDDTYIVPFTPSQGLPPPSALKGRTPALSRCSVFATLCRRELRRVYVQRKLETCVRMAFWAGAGVLSSLVTSTELLTSNLHLEKASEHIMLFLKIAACIYLGCTHAIHVYFRHRPGMLHELQSMVVKPAEYTTMLSIVHGLDAVIGSLIFSVVLLLMEPVVSTWAAAATLAGNIMLLSIPSTWVALVICHLTAKPARATTIFLAFSVFSLTTLSYRMLKTTYLCHGGLDNALYPHVDGDEAEVRTNIIILLRRVSFLQFSGSIHAQTVMRGWASAEGRIVANHNVFGTVVELPVTVRGMLCEIGMEHSYGQCAVALLGWLVALYGAMLLSLHLAIRMRLLSPRLSPQKASSGRPQAIYYGRPASDNV